MGGVKSESNGENRVKYEMIRYKININSREGRLLLTKAYRLAKEPHNNDVGELENITLCYSEEVESEINGENSVND